MYVVNAKDLCDPDNGKPIKSMTTYVTINLPESKESMKTKEKKDDRNPVYK